MSTTGDVVDRSTGGRLARNLALSLSGGALVTLLGASAAHADDLSDAGSTSDGAGAAHSGDAVAVGNRSGSDTQQGGAPSGAVGGIQVTNQTAATGNVGLAVANTGGNVATGNSSTNVATGDQLALTGGGPAVNTGSAGNGSNGSAYISTGNATAVGNESTTSIVQSGPGAYGSLGDILVVNQVGGVLNSGVALANTGDNTATGNSSQSLADVHQENNGLLAGLATNNGTARNDSDGKASVSTGNAAATGNQSHTSLLQSAAGSAGGDLGGLTVISQVAPVVNFGAGLAITGGNTAIGNDSDQVSDPFDANDVEGAFLFQQAFPGDLLGVSTQTGEASNVSDGTAHIATGDANALGSWSTTEVEQTAVVAQEAGGPGAIITQAELVLNVGIAGATTGDNFAVGNGSKNQAIVQQAVDAGALTVGVASNSGSASNASDGFAVITTGDAWARGNHSGTTVDQTALAEGDAFNLLPQVAGVQNLGVAQATTGDNFALGNGSTTSTFLWQTAKTPQTVQLLGPVVLSNVGSVSNANDGSASVTTGAAWASGNESRTTVGQDIDPTGLLIPTQVADVANVGIAVADAGDNDAEGNLSGGEINNRVDLQQDALVGSGGDPSTFAAATVLASNSADLSVDTDGTAEIATGAATATGNQSTTDLGQESDAAFDGAGLVVNTQVAAVVNLGVGLAETGGNTAFGNTSDVHTDGPGNNAVQAAHTGVANDDPATLLAGTIGATNQATLSATTDGTASITTGDADALGNRSRTSVHQDESATITGLGASINTQAAVVLNAGVGVANTGGNGATGNGVFNDEIFSDQSADTASHNLEGVVVVAPAILASNTLDGSFDLDGTASIHTGDASAVGNLSSTEVDQVTASSVSGLGLTLDTQVADVANVGLGVANTGLNVAQGTSARSFIDNRQNALVGSGNALGVEPTLLAVGPVVASNSADLSDASDGSTEITTGDATATGNLSATHLAQDPHSSVDGAGLVLGTQVAGVANVGVGIANTGLNVTDGNSSGTSSSDASNEADAEQFAEVGSNNSGAPTLGVAALLGPITASNTSDLSNASDGHAKIGTGNATATGNSSTTDLTQNQSGTASGGGLVIGTQVGGVANVGVGVANTGVNGAVGNESSSTTFAPNGPGILQEAFVVSESGDPSSITALGPVVASNSAQGSNSSDGEACVCTGDATASGNLSRTTFDQELDLSTEGGLVLLTEAGGVLNAGVGIANSGLNLAVGNTSINLAGASQISGIDDAVAGLPIVGPQVASNAVTVGNTSDGTGKVGTGNAHGVGNDSTTAFTQAAEVDSALAVSTLTGGTTNAGLGLANAGLNRSIGNDSFNQAFLDQSADGSGLVSNQGEVTNDSDGTAIIGDPDCDEVTETPGTPGLPRTGGPLEAEAAVALMLLLAGFGLRRTARRLG